MARCGSVEVLDVYNTLQPRVLPGHRPYRIGEVLTKSRGPLPYLRPTCLLGYVEPDRLAVPLHHLYSYILVTDVLDQPPELVLKDVRELSTRATTAPTLTVVAVK